MDYIQKQYVKEVKECNQNAVKQWKSGVIDGLENRFNPGYAPPPKSELMEVCLLNGALMTSDSA